MEVRSKKVYVASDGHEFSSEEDCKVYEEEMNDLKVYEVKILNPYLKDLKGGRSTLTIGIYNKGGKSNDAACLRLLLGAEYDISGSLNYTYESCGSIRKLDELDYLLSTEHKNPKYLDSMKRHLGDAFDFIHRSVLDSLYIRSISGIQ